MRTVPIEVFQIAKTAVDRTEVKRWMDRIGADNYEIPSEEAASNPALLIALAAKRCYMSFEPGLNPNVTKVRTDIVEYLDNILKSGHGSVLEHSSYSFAIEGVSRVFTGEMNRHRAGVAVSEGSMRYIRFNDIPYWLPTSITLTPEEQTLLRHYPNPRLLNGAVHYIVHGEPHPVHSTDQAAMELVVKKIRSAEVFNRVYGAVETGYSELQSIWSDELAPTSKFHGKKQVTSMMRRIVPMGVATGGVWTLNFRALRHVIAMRASEAAEEEICYVFSKIAKIMIESEPGIFADFTETPEGFFVPKYSKV